MRTKVVIAVITVDGVMQESLDGIIAQDYPNLELIVNQMAANQYSDDATLNKYENCHRNRNAARERALQTDAEYFLFLDDDIVLPSDAVSNLILHKREVIGGWYPILGTNRYVCGRWVDDNKFLNYTGIHRGVVRRDVVGLGCALISRQVLENVKFEAGLDLECTDALTGDKMLLGECGIFGNRVFEMGVEMFLCGEVVCEHLRRGGAEERGPEFTAEEGGGDLETIQMQGAGDAGVFVKDAD